MSDISLGNLAGLVATIGAWAVAAAFAALAVGFIVASLVTGKRTVYGPRVLTAFAFALASFAGGWLLHRLPLETQAMLDETVHFRSLPLLLAGGAVCFRIASA